MNTILQKHFNNYKISLNEIETTIRERMKEIGINKTARLLNTQKSVTSEFVSGKRKFSIKKLEEIANKIC